MRKEEPDHDPRVPEEYGPFERMMNNYKNSFLAELTESVTLELRLSKDKAVKVLEYLESLSKDSGWGKE